MRTFLIIMYWTVVALLSAGYFTGLFGGIGIKPHAETFLMWAFALIIWVFGFFVAYAVLQAMLADLFDGEDKS